MMNAIPVSFGRLSKKRTEGVEPAGGGTDAYNVLRRYAWNTG